MSFSWTFEIVFSIYPSPTLSIQQNVLSTIFLKRITDKLIGLDRKLKEGLPLFFTTFLFNLILVEAVKPGFLVGNKKGNTLF
jgi:hypothetical protein